jgi:hypothetical protein
VGSVTTANACTSSRRCRLEVSLNGLADRARSLRHCA